MITLLVAVTLAPRTPADCPDSLVDVTAVRGLIAARDLSGLDDRFSRVDHHDAALAAVYRRRRLALHPTKEEEIRYLEALPATAGDLSRVYELALTPDICEDPFVSDVVYGMFDRAARLIRKHGAFHRPFIELCDLTDGEIGGVAWPAYDWLLGKDTSRTVAALRSLPAGTRSRLCDGYDPVNLTNRRASKHCRSGI